MTTEPTDTRDQLSAPHTLWVTTPHSTLAVATWSPRSSWEFGSAELVASAVYATTQLAAATDTDTVAEALHAAVVALAAAGVVDSSKAADLDDLSGAYTPPAPFDDFPARGWEVRTGAASFTVAYPTLCPHTPPPVTCIEAPPASPTLPTHEFPHRATCGCWCSGVFRWTHARTPALPPELAEPLARACAAVAGFDQPYPALTHVLTAVTEHLDRGPAWVSLFAELISADLDITHTAHLCDTAHDSTGGR